MVLTLGVLEALVIVATGIEAWAREKRWALRWLVWHLAPLWLLCVAGSRGLRRGVEAAARRSVDRHGRQNRSIVVNEPSDVEDLAAIDPALVQ